MFTFLTLSYNQEKYIIQHLESIKYQVANHGADERAVFILVDDSSKDRTVEWARRWLEENKTLFADIEVLESKENKGVVSNYLKGVNAVKAGGRVKCLAADDLYYKRSVFNVLKGYDTVLSPAICFNDSYDILKNRYYIYKSCCNLSGKKLNARIRHELDFQNKIQAPGAFINLGLLQDRGLQLFLGQYTWIEDYPQWHYIFNQYEKEPKVSIDLEPYVLYRVGSGISLNQDHSKRDDFQKEELKVIEMVRNKREKDKKAGYKCRHLLDMCKTEYLDSYINPSLRRFRKEMAEEAASARLYLKELDRRSRVFLSKWK